MKKISFLFLVLILNITNVFAAEYVIEILPVSFEPEVLEIEVGDTVTWHHTTPRPHSLVAKDGSFNTGDAQRDEWSFSYTFTSANPEFYYSSPQIGHMNGVIQVNDSSEFNVNYGITGSWYETNSPGQGLSIEMLADSKVVVYWFTYTSSGDGKQLWLLGTGDFDNNQASLVFVKPEGGRFNAPQTVESSNWGTGTLTFTDCSNGSLSYASADGQNNGTASIVRITDDVICNTGGLENE